MLNGKKEFIHQTNSTAAVWLYKMQHLTSFQLELSNSINDHIISTCSIALDSITVVKRLYFTYIYFALLANIGLSIWISTSMVPTHLKKAEKFELQRYNSLMFLH